MAQIDIHHFFIILVMRGMRNWYIWVSFRNPLYENPWTIPETIHTYLIFKPNYLTPSPTHQHGYEKAN
jgi:hypothetical protein